MSEKYYTKETGWTEAGIKEQERRADLTKMTDEELGEQMLQLMEAGRPTPSWVFNEVCRRLERLETLEPLYAASESLRCQMQEQTVKDLAVFNQVRERLEKCEAELKQERANVEQLVGDVRAVSKDYTNANKRLEQCEALCEYAQHHAACTWFEGAIGKPQTWICSCGLNAARAAVEGE